MKKSIITSLMALMATMASAQEIRWQQCNESLPVPQRVMPKMITDNNHNDDGLVQYTQDNNLSTIYHSAYAPEFIRVVPEQPAILTFGFRDVERIDYLEYVPRQDGGSNGWVSEAEIYVMAEGDSDFRLYQRCHWPLDAHTPDVEYERPHFEN